MHAIRAAARRARRRTRAAGQAVGRVWSGPGRERDLAVQAGKAALAAWIAWAVVGRWLDAPMAFVAPWVAIVLVESTVYRSIAYGLQQLAAITTGTVVATAAALLLHDTMTAMALVLPATVLLGQWRRLGSQGIYAATGALFVLTGGSVGIPAAAARIGEAVFGAVVGIAVNALIRPPLYLRDTRIALRDALRETHDILHAVADGLDQGKWDAQEAGTCHERALCLQRLVGHARSTLSTSRESLRVNLRRTGPTPLHGGDYDDAVVVLDYAALHTADVTRTVLEAAAEVGPAACPHPALARRYAVFLRRTADTLRLYDQSRFGHQGDRELRQAVRELHRTLDALRHHVTQAGPGSPGEFATYGTLLTQAHRLAGRLTAHLPEPQAASSTAGLDG
ncbi:aromatic acid exporter family protein [Streptomyces sp. NBC_01622]|uniref:FUSC family protein n=1 Tax=Streptomyces sp. NBC_01622 TaxID=2975903 RepID=UPI00386A49A0|nr:aromatic acid exporter family protein [Streptomyces sp. NBC_01622]